MFFVLLATTCNLFHHHSMPGGSYPTVGLPGATALPPALKSKIGTARAAAQCFASVYECYGD